MERLLVIVIPVLCTSIPILLVLGYNRILSPFRRRKLHQLPRLLYILLLVLSFMAPLMAYYILTDISRLAQFLPVTLAGCIFSLDACMSQVDKTGKIQFVMLSLAATPYYITAVLILLFWVGTIFI